MKTRPRVLLLGARGQVGTELAICFQDTELSSLGRSEADFSQPESLRAVVRALSPNVILNAAAYTAVDRAETETELADRVNHLAPRVLAEEAERAGALLVHYSTDYVFDGNKEGAWLETDVPAPLNVYGASKLRGEQAISRACRRFVILRTSWVYAPHGHNFLQTMLRLGRERSLLRVVNDQWGAPTPAGVLAEVTRAVVAQVHVQASLPETWAGIYHASCEGCTSWCGFAEEIFRQAASRETRPWPTVEGIPGSEYPTPARRPHNSVLSKAKLAETFGLRFSDWKSALEAVFTELS